MDYDLTNVPSEASFLTSFSEALCPSTLFIHDDVSLELDETIRLKLSVSSPSTDVIVPDTLVITILDNEGM